LTLLPEPGAMLADNEMAVASHLPRKMQSEILPGTNGQQQPEEQQ